MNQRHANEGRSPGFDQPHGSQPQQNLPPQRPGESGQVGGPSSARDVIRSQPQGLGQYGDQQGLPGHDQHEELHDPDYHQWRSEQIRRFDEDYRNWRQERFRRFSEEFNQWRQGRHQQGMGPQAASLSSDPAIQRGGAGSSAIGSTSDKEGAGEPGSSGSASLGAGHGKRG